MADVGLQVSITLTLVFVISDLIYSCVKTRVSRITQDKKSSLNRSFRRLLVFVTQN